MVRSCLPVTIVAAALVVLAGSPAAADVAVVKGGPRAAARAPVDVALAEAARAMDVCWRGRPPRSVRVAVTVAASGAVSARPIGKHGAAQCAAGILAVWTLPGGAWSGEVTIDAGHAPRDLGAAIQRQVMARAADLRACQDRDPRATGPVAIKMKVQTDGRVTDVTVSSKLGRAIDRCVESAAGKLRLDPTGAAGPVSYQLSISFAGGGGSGAPAERPPEPAGGQVGGALAASDVKRVLTGARTRLLACAKRGKARGKVVTRFTVRPDGTVKNVVVKESIGDAGIEACLKKVYAGLTFPKATAETRVSYPVELR